LLKKSKNKKKAKKVIKTKAEIEYEKKIKNIAKNYGQAICSFILGEYSEEYLARECQAYSIPKDKFKEFVRDRRNVIRGPDGLRYLLQIDEQFDSQEEANMKKIFQYLGIVFIKCFSVNWIFDSKLSYKEIYLKFRFKVLRRFQNPENFTPLK